MTDPEPPAAPSVPVPEELLVPLLEEAADTLRGLESIDVPQSLRPIHGFDRRGLLAGPARRQLRRALEQDARFRSLVFERFEARDEVMALVLAWSVEAASERVVEADDRHDLALLVSALWVAQPAGAEFGLGLAVATHTSTRAARGSDEARRAEDRERATVEEAWRRADAARLDAEAELERVTSDLQKERSARRAREENALHDAQTAHRDAEKLAGELADARALLQEEQTRVARTTKRAQALDEDVRKLRAELDTERRRHPRPAVDERDVRAIAEAAASIDHASAVMRALERRLRDASRAAAPAVESAVPEPAPVARRAPDLPGGLVADSARGVEAMLRTPDVVLVIDGYNVTKRAWGDATPADQRERLGIAVTALNRRVGCGALLVFDGDGSGIARPSIRRGGVRVLFSDAAEEADEVVVREVAAMPKRIPVVVASSDGWIREHAGAAGAVVVSADALLGVLRPDR